MVQEISKQTKRLVFQLGKCEVLINYCLVLGRNWLKQGGEVTKSLVTLVSSKSKQNNLYYIR